MIRLLLLIGFFLLSLLAVFKAPAFHLWLMAIAVAELPWVFAAITLILLLFGFRSEKYQLAGTTIGIIALFLFLTPIIRAYIVSNTLSHNLNIALGENDRLNKGNSVKPYSFWQSFNTDHKKVSLKTFTYISYNDISLDLDFYPSQQAGKHPCIIVIHGGSWSGGDSKQIPELNSLLAYKGFNVAAINYRMAPKYQTPAPIEDIKSSLIYLRKHADSLQIDTNKFVLLGRSAGAQIAMLAAYTLQDPSIKGVIDFYGPADMVWGYSIPTNPLIMDSRKVMENYIGGKYQNIPNKYAACSPIEFVNKQSPPTLIIHGQNDVLVAYEHSRRLNQKLQQNGIKHFWLELPWATHGFDYIQNGSGGQLANYTINKFLQNVTK